MARKTHSKLLTDEDHRLALQGITLMLNNGFKESQVLFNKHRFVNHSGK